MPLGRVQVTFDCADPEAVGLFWAEVLGYPKPDVAAWRDLQRTYGLAEEDLENTFAIDDPDGVRPRLYFQRVPEPKVVKNRVHLDIAASAGPGGDRRAEIDAEVARVVALGATVVGPVVDEAGYFMVMADIEQNEFCID